MHVQGILRRKNVNNFPSNGWHPRLAFGFKVIHAWHGWYFGKVNEVRMQTDNLHYFHSKIILLNLAIVTYMNLDLYNSHKCASTPQTSQPYSSSSRVMGNLIKILSILKRWHKSLAFSANFDFATAVRNAKGTTPASTVTLKSKSNNQPSRPVTSSQSKHQRR